MCRVAFYSNLQLHKNLVTTPIPAVVLEQVKNHVTIMTFGYELKEENSNEKMCRNR